MRFSNEKLGLKSLLNYKQNKTFITEHGQYVHTLYTGRVVYARTSCIYHMDMTFNMFGNEKDEEM